MIRLQVVHINSGQTAHDRIAFCTFHSFLVGVQKMLATYMQCIHNSYQEVRTEDSYAWSHTICFSLKGNRNTNKSNTSFTIPRPVKTIT